MKKSTKHNGPYLPPREPESATPTPPVGAEQKQLIVVPVPDVIKQIIAEKEAKIGNELEMAQSEMAQFEARLNAATFVKKDALLAATRAELSEKIAQQLCDTHRNKIAAIKLRYDAKNLILQGLLAAHGYELKDMMPNFDENGDAVLMVKSNF